MALPMIDIGTPWLPPAVPAVWEPWPVVSRAYVSGEISGNAGGLIRWPVYALIPAGFALLMLQGVSELIKRIAFLRGAGTDPMALPHDPHADSGAAPDAPAAKAGQ